MNINFRWIFLVIIFNGCSTPQQLGVPYIVPAVFPIQDSTQTFLIIDAGDISTTGIAIVKKREQVIENVKKEYLQMLLPLVEKTLDLQVTIDSTLTPDQKLRVLQNDLTMIDSLRNKHNAGILVVLMNCYGGFERDDVLTEKHDDGSKSKTAYYSVFFESTWKVIQGMVNQEKIVEVKKPHSSRPIISGLLARGPGFKANKKDLLEVAGENAYKFTGLFQDREVLHIPGARY